MDIDAGEALVDAIKPLAGATKRPGADGSLGGFGGLFDLKAAGFSDPVLVAATDGVGTKLMLAIESGIHNTVGIDLVAMCVNDLVVQGAEPLMFLDYYATGKLDVDAGRDIVAGIAEGCRLSGSALVGGETAEMPGLYSEGDYDLAGFSVGAAEREDLITEPTVQDGDIILGLASNGLHSNGFSLVRRVIERSGLALDQPAPFADGQTLAEAMLRPTRIYVKSCLAALKAGGVNGLAHITGGGLIENPPRVYGDHLTAQIDVSSWDMPPVFSWLADMGGIEPLEMARTFNCGIGMMLMASPDQVSETIDILTEHGEQVFKIGQMIERQDGRGAVDLINLHDRWPR